jgi:hypothetical protein
MQQAHRLRRAHPIGTTVVVLGVTNNQRTVAALIGTNECDN